MGLGFFTGQCGFYWRNWVAVTVVGGGDLGVEECGHGFGIWWELIRDMMKKTIGNA